MSRTCFFKKEVPKYLIKNRKQETSFLVSLPTEGLSLPRATGSGAHWLSGQPQVTSNWLPTHRGRGQRQEEQSSKVSERPMGQRDRRGGRCWGQNERKQRRSSSHRTYVSLYTERTHPVTSELREKRKSYCFYRMPSSWGTDTSLPHRHPWLLPRLCTWAGTSRPGFWADASCRAPGSSRRCGRWRDKTPPQGFF